MKVFIQSIAQISIQDPLSEHWLDAPLVPQNILNESVEPDYKEFLAPMESRRMGLLLKRAIVTSKVALQKANLDNVDAVISGTGLGCIDNTEKFLNALINNDEECLPPTPFMQSTHNTISSQIAISIKCHGYNSTYSHRGTSFDNSLLDAFVQMKLGNIHSALVGGHDEMTIDYFKLLNKVGYWKKENMTSEQLKNSNTEGSLSGSCSVSVLLSDTPTDTSLCTLRAIEMMYAPTMGEFSNRLNKILSDNDLQIQDIDAVMMGLNGDADNDRVYQQIASSFFAKTPIVWYKHLFGESFSASAFGVYVAATCLAHQNIPAHLLYHNTDTKKIAPKNVLVHNHFHNKDHSLMLLSL